MEKQTEKKIERETTSSKQNTNNQQDKNITPKGVCNETDETGPADSSYINNASQIPKEAVEGMISAMEDVKNGNYTVLTNDSQNVQIASQEDLE